MKRFIRTVLPMLVVSGAMPAWTMTARAQEARGEQQSICGRAPAGDDPAAPLWEQVSSALRAVSERGAQSATPKLRVVHRQNSLSRDRVEQGSTVTLDDEGVNRMPMAEAPDQLATLGYVRRDTGRNVTYHAPDERVFVSDVFLATHCFTAPARKANASTAELRFKPIKGRRVADIEGTMVVDLTRGNLTRITFRYVNSPERVRAQFAGGEIILRRLPGGEWIMSEWTLRYPRVTSSSPSTEEWVLDGYTELTGAVQDPQAGAGTQPPDR